MQCVCVCVCVCTASNSPFSSYYQTMETTLHCKRNWSLIHQVHGQAPWHLLLLCHAWQFSWNSLSSRFTGGGFIQGYHCHEMQASTSNKIISLKLTILVLSCLHWILISHQPHGRQHSIRQWFSKCGPWTKQHSLTWELVQSENSRSSPQANWNQKLWGWARQSLF